MNKAQRVAWVTMVVLFLLSCLVPPWRLGLAEGGTRLQFAGLFWPPDRVVVELGYVFTVSQELAWGVLGFEWLAIALAAACLHFALRTSRPSPPPGAPSSGDRPFSV